MNSSVKTVDALIAERRSFPKSDYTLKARTGISMQALGFKNVKHKDVPQRAISKVIDPNTLINE